MKALERLGREVTPARLIWEITEGRRRLYALGSLALFGINVLDILPPFVLGLLIDSVSKRTSSLTPIALASAYVGVFVLQSLFRYPMKMGFVGASAQIAGAWREQYGAHVLMATRESLRGCSTGDLLSRATSDINAVEDALARGFLYFFDCTAYLLVIPAAMLIISPGLCVWSFGFLFMVPFFAFRMIRTIGKASQEVQELSGKMLTQAHENASAVQTVRAFGMEEEEISRFGVIADAFFVKCIAQARLETALSSSIQCVMTLGTITILLVGGEKAIEGEISIGKFVAFLQYMGMMTWPLTGLIWAFLLLRKGEIALRRVLEVLNLPVLPHASGAPLPETGGALEIRGLTYQYPGTQSAVLSNLSLSVGRGQRIAIIGPLGSGKSTLIDLITRVIEPPSGTVFVDDQDVRTVNLRDLRQQMAVVSQDPFLFSGTIHENILVGAPCTANHNMIAEQAALSASLAEDRLPDGLQTVLSERGRNLSGGQRERTSLARALARGAPFLFLDDGLSALDAVTEEAIFHELARVAKSCTLLFVTQRVRRAREADRILVLDQGQLVEQGTHTELLRRNGIYAQFARRQALSDAFDAR